MRFREIGGAVLDLIWPPALYCICCGKIIDETRTYRLCDTCMDSLKWVPVGADAAGPAGSGSRANPPGGGAAARRICAKCGKILSEFNPLDICFNCREHGHEFDRGFTCTEYGTNARAIVFALKYDDRPDIGDTLGEILYDRMTAEFSPDELACMYDLVLPVPVHPRKLNTRGYNQAMLMAQGFCLRAGLKADDAMLYRKRETHMMRSLTPDQRRENIRGAFGIRDYRKAELRGLSILLIDDIYTTGATVDEIARILRSEGASCVDVLTFAAGADVVKSM